MENKTDKLVIKDIKPKKPVAKKPTGLSMKKLLQKIEDLEKKLEEKTIVPEPIEQLPIIKQVEDPDEKKERLRLRDRELVVGTFRYHEVEGGHVKFTFHKWERDPIETFLLNDGYRYALPRGVAMHLRDTGKFKSRPGIATLGNAPTKEVVLNRYSFERDDFGENEDISKIPRGYAPKNVE